MASGIVGGGTVVATPPEYMNRIIQTYQANLPRRFPLSGEGGTLTAFSSLDFRSARIGFSRLMAVLDNKELANRGQGSPPLFFSQNLASLLECLSRVELISLDRRQATGFTSETVTYKLVIP